MKRSIKRSLLLYGAYSIFFSICFVLCAYWFFPYNRLRDYIVQEVERPAGEDGRRRPSGIELEIAELNPSWLTGIELEGVSVTKLPDNPDDDPVRITLDEVSARVSVLALLTGGIEASFATRVGAGHIEGMYADDGERTVVEADLSNVDLEQLGVLRAVISLPITGKISGKIDLTLANEAAQTEGSVELAIADLTIGDGEAKLKLPNMGDGVTIEQIDAGTLQLNVSVDGGVADVEELSSDGDDLELAGAGTVRLIKPFSMSRLDLLLRIQFNESYRERNNRTQALFSLIELSPQTRPARTPDGALQYRVRGSFGSRITPQPAGREPSPGS